MAEARGAPTGSGSAVAIIPARGGSTRLPRKNVYSVLGAPMLAWVVRACSASRYISGVYVSTEDREVADVARAAGAQVIDRPASLSRDGVPKQEVIIHAVEQLERGRPRLGIVAAVQPNSPEVEASMLDAAIDKLRARSLWEVFSVGPDLVQNAAFRILRRDAVFHRGLSVYCGVVVADVIDVHTADDVVLVEDRLRRRGARAPRAGG